jgi:4a-hydroxytetrahydrobiopterin dehydratase
MTTEQTSNTTCSLANKTCVPCRGGVPAIKGDPLKELAKGVPEWEIVEEHHLRRAWTFKNFADALAFVNRVGALAEEQGHHPTVELSWGRVVVTLHTHKIDGLSESDFILAAKIDRLSKE